MNNVTRRGWCYGFALATMLAITGSAWSQTRTVTLTLNASTIPDTTSLDSFMEVRGQGDGMAPFTLPDGNVIDWSDASTLEPVNIGGDYWQISFELADTTELTFKFYNDQVAQIPSFDGWEADPNPTIPPGTNDTTLVVHYFESQDEYRGATGDRGPYDWRPFESKPDTVAVWFRVFMATDYAYSIQAPNKYDRLDAGQVIAVRGDNLGGAGPLDWGANNATLDVESSEVGGAGYHMFSGVAYYPASLAGTTQPYKFIVNDGGWEEGIPDRTFTVPEADTTLRWVFFANSPASTQQPVESAVVFSVDLQPLEQIGVFSKARGDTIWVFGSFNEWEQCPANNPDNCSLAPVAGTNIYENEFSISQVPATTLSFKYFVDFNNAEFEAEFGTIPPAGWEEGHRTGINRVVSFDGTEQQIIPQAYYNDVEERNIVEDGNTVNVNFSVDMTPALSDLNQPFDADLDSVWIEIQDPLWAVTQGFTFELDGANVISQQSVNGGDRPEILLSDDDEDGVYTGTVAVAGPTYGILTYKYLYGRQLEGYVSETGGSTEPPPGRNRTRFIHSNPDGSWPDSWDFPAEEFHNTAGPLPFEENTVGVEQIDSELPEKVTLLGNYPNPFSASTTFDYTVTEKTKVTISVYNVLGQRVATVVDGVQAAGTYRATFEPRGLSSGTYFYRLEAEGQVVARPMIIVK